MAATAFAATSLMQSSAKATALLITNDSAAATGLSESFASRTLGRPKCASRITLPPLAEISVIVGATRSRRGAAVTRPCSMGNVRATAGKHAFSLHVDVVEGAEWFCHGTPRSAHPSRRLRSRSALQDEVSLMVRSAPL